MSLKPSDNASWLRKFITGLAGRDERRAEGNSLPAATVDLACHATGDAEPGLSDAASMAAAIRRTGMEGPASVALRIVKPLAWVGGQMLWVIQPLIEGLGRSGTGRDRNGTTNIARLATFLEEEENVSSLLTHLEDGPGNARRASTSNDGGRR